MSDTPTAPFAWNRVWGTIGGGAGAGVIVGASGGYAQLINLGDSGLVTNAFLLSTRLGLWAGWEAGIQLVFVTGARTAAEIDKLDNSGWGFQLDLGGKIGTTAKLGGRLLSKIDEILAMLENCKALGKYADANEKTKGFLQEAILMFIGTGGQINFAEKAAFVIGLPIGAGVGAGVYYEWGTIYTTGTDHRAWDRSKVEWQLLSDSGQLRLHLRQMPLADGVPVWLEFVEDGFLWMNDNLRFNTGRNVNGKRMFRAMSRFGRAESSMSAGAGSDASIPMVGLPNNPNQAAPYRPGVGGIGRPPADKSGKTLDVFLRVYSAQGDSDAPGDKVWESNHTCRISVDNAGRVRSLNSAWLS